MAGALPTASGGRVRGPGLGFGGSPPERLEEGALVLPGHDVDALPAADLLAQLAPHTGLLVHLDLAEVGREVLARRADAVERADVDAHAAAVAVVGMHDGDGPLLALQDLGDVAPGVEDRLVGADDAARAAVDAERGLDVVRLLGIAADRLGGTPLLARGASRAILGDDGEGHAGTLTEYGARRQASALHLPEDFVLPPLLDQAVVAQCLLETHPGEEEDQDEHEHDRDVVRLREDAEELMERLHPVRVLRTPHAVKRSAAACIAPCLRDKSRAIPARSRHDAHHEPL